MNWIFFSIGLFIGILGTIISVRWIVARMDNKEIKTLRSENEILLSANKKLTNELKIAERERKFLETVSEEFYAEHQKFATIDVTFTGNEIMQNATEIGVFEEEK
jgi:hypothetical protein